MIYFEEPDMHGHVYGPESNEVLSVLKTLDNITSYLDVSILQKNLHNHNNNLLVFSLN